MKVRWRDARALVNGAAGSMMVLRAAALCSVHDLAFYRLGAREFRNGPKDALPRIPVVFAALASM
jgi:hypothetical protein